MNAAKKILSQSLTTVSYFLYFLNLPQIFVITEFSSHFTSQQKLLVILKTTLILCLGLRNYLKTFQFIRKPTKSSSFTQIFKNDRGSQPTMKLNTLIIIQQVFHQIFQSTILLMIHKQSICPIVLTAMGLMMIVSFWRISHGSSSTVKRISFF